MQTPVDVTPGFNLQPRLRVFSGSDMVLGWGKIMLLKLVQEHGSIAEAARTMDMSYNHAWSLIRVMNNSFKEPLVTASRGGPGKGGAQVTETGVKVLKLYEEMAEECLKATKGQWRKLQNLMRSTESE
ncbi:MAG: winged helix-turn-helix domain-containing protein [Verrucomicrobium sp.]|nr:LysR family transcriptional regulator [Verrucomicrobium sp.]